MDRRWQTLLLDVLPGAAFAAFLVVISPLAGPGADDGIDALGSVILAATGMTLALHRRAPVAGCLASFVLTFGYFALDYPGGPIFLAPLATLLPVVAARPPRVWVPLALTAALALSVVNWIIDGWTVGLVGSAAVWGAVPFVFAAFLRLRRDQAAIAEAETRGLVAEERLRMARELHDVVGHALSTISLHAGVAERALETRPEQVRESVVAVRQISKEALDELRAVLGVLRDGAGSARAPTPGLAALPGLVATMQDAGVHVRLDVDRPPGTRVPEVVGAAAYRIVQESLTNVVRHAGRDVNVRVRVAAGRRAVELDVRDDGRGAVNGWRRGSGIAGMEQRAAALGGRLTAGPVPGGGFRVQARLPLEER